MKSIKSDYIHAKEECSRSGVVYNRKIKYLFTNVGKISSFKGKKTIYILTLLYMQK